MRGLKNNWKRVENTDIDLLSKPQEQVLKYLTEEFLTIQQIANLRGTSDKAVYKIISKLKKKGYIKGVEKHSTFRGGSYHVTTKGENKKIYRLHALNFRIEILNSSEKYIKLLSKRNRDELDNNTLKLYKDNIVIYLNKDFWGDDPIECESISLKYINKYITMLENNYKIILKQGRKFNLMQFRGEIAKTNDAYAEECNINRDKIEIRDDNGVLRLLVDNSYNLNELEAVSNEHHINDMNQINKKWLDLIKSDLMLSDVENHLKVQQHINMTTSEKIDKLINVIENLIDKKF